MTGYEAISCSGDQRQFSFGLAFGCQLVCSKPSMYLSFNVHLHVL